MESAITTVDKVMRPVTELKKVTHAMTVSEIKTVAKQYSRLVVEDEKGQILGVLKVKDLLCLQDAPLKVLINSKQVVLKQIVWMGPNTKLHLVAKAFKLAGTQFGLVCASAEDAQTKNPKVTIL
jgi:CBS domain containing-hemolysin-like protein